MNKPMANYQVNAVVPPDLISPLLELLQTRGGHLVQMTSHLDSPPYPRKNGVGRKRKPSKLGKHVTAHEVILMTLKDEDGELHRADLRKALQTSGHSPASVGPICSMLQKKGRVFSPRRGFWQIRA